MATDTNFTYVPYKNANRLGNASKDTKYDDKKFQQFLVSQDYEGAALYAGQFKPKDTKKKIALESQLNQLKLYGARLNKLTSNIKDDDTKQAVSFKFALDNGLMLPGEYTTTKGTKEHNKYTDQYRQYMSLLGSSVTPDGLISNSSNNDADSISIKFANAKNGNWFTRLLGIDSDEDTFDTFLKGLTNECQGDNINSHNAADKLNKLGIEYNKSADGTEIKISKSNSNILNVLRAYNNSGLDKENTGINGINDKNKYIDDMETKRGGDMLASRSSRNKDTVTDLLGFLNTVSSKATTPENDDYKGEDAQSMIISADFNSQVDAVAWQDYCNGKLSNEQYAKVKAHIDESVLGALTTAFTQNEVYYSDAENDVLHYAKVEDRQKLEDFYNLAAKDPEKNLKIRAAKVGDRYGTYVEIAPEGAQDDNKSKYNKSGYATERNPNVQTMKIFIPDLEKGGSMQALYADPKSRAMTQLSDMKAYGYEVDSDYKDEHGNTVSSTVGYNPTTQQFTMHNYNTGKDIAITGEAAQQILAKHYAYNSIMDSFNDNIRDDDGNLNYQSMEKPLTYWAANIKNWINEYYPMLDASAQNDLGKTILNAMLQEYGIDENKIGK